jgi:hypothetical protein
VSDLYSSLFGRAADSNGLSYWVGQLNSGVVRDNVMDSFLFSAEYTNKMTAAFPGASARKETYMVLNLYGGLLRGLPDTAGYIYWDGQLRTAQCSGNPAAAVLSAIDTASGQFTTGSAYIARATSNGRYVSDLYYAMLQRGAEPGGYVYWVGQLNSSVLTRAQVRQQFMSSSEIQTQSAAIAAQGCLP